LKSGDAKDGAKKDPFKGKRGTRGPKKYSFTIHDVAKLADLDRSGVDWYVRERIVDLTSLSSVVAFVSGRLEKKADEEVRFSWKQVADLLELPEKDVRARSKKRTKYLRVEGKRARKEVEPDFCPTDLKSLHAYVEQRRWESCSHGSDDPKDAQADALRTVVEYLEKYKPELAPSVREIGLISLLHPTAAEFDLSKAARSLNEQWIALSKEAATRRYKVSVGPGGAPVISKPSALACRNCGDLFSEAAEEAALGRDAPGWRPCPNPSPGTPMVHCGVGGHTYDLTVNEPVTIIRGSACCGYAAGAEGAGMCADCARG
jgi:hypothetical protein